jgi:hypothetical protein
MTDCLVGKAGTAARQERAHPRRTGGRAWARGRVRHRLWLAYPMLCLLVLLGVLTTFAPESLQQRWPSAVKRFEHT